MREALAVSRARLFWEQRRYDGVGAITNSHAPAHWQEAYLSAFRALVLQRLKRALGDVRLRRVVDLGCGPGEWTLRYLELAERVVGLDVNLEFLEAARRTAAAAGCEDRTQFLAGDMLAYDDYDEADLVCLGASVQYLDDDDLDALLARLATAPPRGARLYVRTTLASPLRGSYHGNVGYFRTRGDYERRFARQGLEIVDACYSAAVLPAQALRDLLRLPPSWSERLAFPVWGLVCGFHALSLQGLHHNWLLRKP